jgi:hypothetical protein
MGQQQIQVFNHKEVVSPVDYCVSIVLEDNASAMSLGICLDFILRHVDVPSTKICF